MTSDERISNMPDGENEESQGPSEESPVRFGWIYGVKVNKDSVHLHLQQGNWEKNAPNIGKFQHFLEASHLFLSITDSLYDEYLGSHPLSPTDMDHLSGRNWWEIIYFSAYLI